MSKTIFNKHRAFIFLCPLILSLLTYFPVNATGSELNIRVHNDHIAAFYDQTETKGALFDKIPTTLNNQSMINEACFYLGKKTTLPVRTNESIWAKIHNHLTEFSQKPSLIHCMICIQRKGGTPTQPINEIKLIHNDTANSNAVSYTNLDSGEILVTLHISSDTNTTLDAVENYPATTLSPLTHHSLSASMAVAIENNSTEKQQINIKSSLKYRIKELLNLSKVPFSFRFTPNKNNSMPSRLPIHDLLTHKYYQHVTQDQLTLKDSDADLVAHYIMAFAQLVKKTPPIAASLTTHANANRVLNKAWTPSQTAPSNYLWNIFNQTMTVTAIPAEQEPQQPLPTPTLNEYILATGEFNLEAFNKKEKAIQENYQKVEAVLATRNPPDSGVMQRLMASNPENTREQRLANIKSLVEIDNISQMDNITDADEDKIVELLCRLDLNDRDDEEQDGSQSFQPTNKDAGSYSDTLMPSSYSGGRDQATDASSSKNKSALQLRKSSSSSSEDDLYAL